MATTTLVTARRELAALLGYAEEVGKDGTAWSTTTSLTGTAAAVLIDTKLRDYGFDDFEGAASGDDFFQNWWVMILGTNNAQVVRRVASYDASAGQVTVAGTTLATEPSGAVSFELHKYSPTLLRESLNTARVTSYPMLYAPVTRSLYTSTRQVRYEIPSAIIGRPHSIWLDKGVHSTYGNSILTDGAFEVWTTSTSLTNWTATTLDTLQESAATTPVNYAVFRDGYSARCQSQTGSVGTLLQSISSPGTHSGQRINLSVWVYCLTPSVVSTRITVNGTITLGTALNGGLHTGTGWELLTGSVDSLVTITTLTVGVSVVSTATDDTEFYVDEAICVVGPTQEPEDAAELVQSWEYVPIQQSTTARNEVVFPGAFPDKYRLRFEGKGYLSSVSAETDTFEIGAPQTQLLYAFAARELYSRLKQHAPTSEAEYYADLIKQMEHRIQDYSHFALSGPRQRLQIPDWS